MRYSLAKDGLEPKPDNLTLICLGVGYTYYHDRIGYELKFHYLMTKADKEDYKPLYVYNDYLFSGGIVLVPFQFREGASLAKIEIRSGINYDIFSFDPALELDELGSANGIGFYADLGINFINDMTGLFFGTFFEYNYLYSKYPGAQKAIDGNNFIFYFRLGKVFL